MEYKKTKRTKVVHVTFDMRIGGTEQVICNLIENTDVSKYEVSILCLEQCIGPFGIKLREKGYSIISLGRKPGFDLSLVKKIHCHLISQNVDVLHCHQYTPYVYGVMGALFTKCKVIFTEHGRFYPDQKKKKRVLVNPIINLATNYITAISEATRGALAKYEKFPKSKIRVIYNGLDDTKYKNDRKVSRRSLLGIDEETFVIGTVARLDSIKNHKMMIKTLKIVHKIHPNTFLLIVGDGPERENLERLVRKLEIASHVIFTGFKQNPFPFYSVMDVFLLTSFSEGTAMTLLESMSSNLPCVVTNVGGNPEIVKNNETGFIVPADDDQSLAELISRFINDADLMKKYGDAGRARFKEMFAVEKMVEAYEKLYESSLG